METGLWSGEVKRESGRDRDRRARISRRLQRQPEHKIGATRQLGRVRCSRTRKVQNGRWHAFGKKILDANGEPVRVPGMLKHVKAIGRFVKEYGIAQVSMNLTNIEETPLH